MSIKILSLTSFILISLASFSQRLEKMILENWVNSAWENKMRELPYYDESGRMIRKEIAHWNEELKQWIDHTKTLLHRDENGVLLSKETYKWNLEMANWEPDLRWSYSVNENKQPSKIVTESYGEEGWHNQSLDEFHYDSSGNVIGKTFSNWDKAALSWKPSQTIDYEFVGNRKMGYTIRVWKNTMNDWQFYKRATIYYSKSGSVESIFYETWIDEVWQNHYNRDYFFDELGSLKGFEVEMFKSDFWEKSSRVEYELTLFGKISSSTSKSWHASSSEWENLQRSTYYYSEEGQFVPEWESQQELELFPNPAQEKLTIRSLPRGKLTVHDVLGNIIYQIENDENELQLNVSNWAKGTYSIQIDGREFHQFLKQ